MKRLFHSLSYTFTLTLFLAFASPAIISNAQIINDPPAKTIPTETDTSKTPQIEIDLNKKLLTKGCLKDKQCENLCPMDGQNTKVSVLTKNIKDENLTYNYAVSGGTIIGQGPNVIWDFVDADPGYYTIGVEVTDGKDVSIKSEKKKITLIRCVVSESKDDPPCIAPTINVTSPTDSVRAGETIEFTVNLSGGSQKAVAYNWYIQSRKETVAAGHQASWMQSELVFEGQSTSVIKIKTTSATEGETLVATVEISGLCMTGPRTASAGVFVSNPQK